MAELVLFHHALGRTKGIYDFAEALAEDGHTVHIPDLFEGLLFASIEDGMAYVEEIGFEVIIERGLEAARKFPRESVYAGFSLGVLPAQKLAQTRAGCRGALLFYAFAQPAMLGSAWPADVPVQIHGMDADPIFAGEGDLDAARELVASSPRAELFLYPGDRHYFADSSLPSYDPDAAALLLRRVREFLRELDEGK